MHQKLFSKDIIHAVIPLFSLYVLVKFQKDITRALKDENKNSDQT